MTKKDFFIAIILTILCFFVRTYKIDNPIADHHSFRQADTAAVARNFIKGDFNILYPQSDSYTELSEHQLANPNRYFLNEFPLYNAIVALIYEVRGINTVYARLVSIFFASLGTFFLYLIGKKLFCTKIATLATLFYALIPYNIYYGRVIMPDPTFICFSVISFYLLLEFVEKPNFVRGILFSCAFAIAMLVKPYAVFLFIPFIFWVFANHGWSAFKKPMFYLAPILSVIPILLWRYHIGQHPEGQFYSTWLLNKYNIRFTGAFFRWLIFDRMNRLILATGGFVLFFFGIIKSIKSKNGVLLLVWLLSVFTYFTVFAAGNVTHDYYQMPFMPVAALLVSLGFFEIIANGKNLVQKIFLTGVSLSLLVISFAFGWYEVRGFFNINDWNMIEAGKEIDKITPKDAKVIAPYQTDPSFLYQTNRYGWTMGYDIDKKIAQGAAYYVSTSYDDEARDLEKKYIVVEKNDKYIIIKLEPKAGK